MKIIIIHPLAIVRDGLRRLLEAEGCEIVADADHAGTLVSRRPEPVPDVVFLGAEDDRGEVVAIRQLRALLPDVKVIILSTGITHEPIDRAIDAGAAGYLLRSSGFEDLLTALHGVARSDRSESGRVAVRGPSRESTVPCANWLTRREREVVSLLAAGNRTRDIAHLLGISEKTVDSHRQNIKKKLGLDNLASLTKFAIREGLSSLLDEDRRLADHGVGAS